MSFQDNHICNIYTYHAFKGDTDMGNCHLGTFVRKWILHVRWRLLKNGSAAISWGSWTLMLVYDWLWCYMSNVWPSRGCVSVPWGTGLRQGCTHWSHSRLLAVICRFLGVRVRLSTKRIKWFAFFSSHWRKCFLLDAPHQVEQEGNISSWGKTVSVLLKAGIRLVALRKET